MNLEILQKAKELESSIIQNKETLEKLKKACFIKHDINLYNQSNIFLTSIKLSEEELDSIVDDRKKYHEEQILKLETQLKLL